MNIFRHNSLLNRQRLRTEGKMAKGPGMHSVFGKPYKCRVSEVVYF